MRRRARQGFSIAWGENGIVSMIRQVQTPHEKLLGVGQDGGAPLDGASNARVEQCIVFGPVMSDSGLPPTPEQ